MEDLSLVMDKPLKKHIMEMLSKHKNLWSGRLGTLTTTLNKVDLKEETRSISQHPRHAEQRSRQILCEHVGKQLEAVIIQLAQSECANCIH